MPPLLTFGSWMGGDRDGNPNVTAAVTAEALDMMRTACLHLLEARIEVLAQRVSLSDRLVGRAEALGDALAALAELFPEEAARAVARNPEEPYRRYFSLIVARVRATREGDARRLRRPDRAARRPAARAAAAAAAGRASSSRRPSSTTRSARSRCSASTSPGSTSASTRRATARRSREVLSALGVHEAYGSLGSAERTALLAREIAERRPLIPSDLSAFSPATQEVVGTFRVLG